MIALSMDTPTRDGFEGMEERRHDSGQQHTNDGHVDRGGVEGGQSPSPSPAKLRQAQRRYRSLFQQAAREFQLWCEGEEESQRALGSAFHLLDRLQILEGGHKTGDAANLGGLEHLPGCRALLIRKHAVELERVTRLWRALVQQMRGQVALVEESLAEAWRLHRSEPKLRLQAAPSPNVQPQPQPSTKAGVEQSPGLEHARRHVEEAACSTMAGTPDASQCLANTLATTRGLGGGPGSARAAGAARTILGDWGAPVGPAEYLQWLGDLSSMLVHEQWRKEELLSRVNFAPEDSSARVRAHVQARWSSRSADSFLDRKGINAALTAAQLVPFPKNARRPHANASSQQ